MGKDKRGVNRGNCQKCDCKEYEVFDKRLLCDYCGHRPVDHEIQQETTRPKRKCSPKKDYAVSKKQKAAEGKGTPVVKVEPLQTAGGKRIMSVSTGPVTRRSRRSKLKTEVETETQKDEYSDATSKEETVQPESQQPEDEERALQTDTSDKTENETVIVMELDPDNKGSREEAVDEEENNKEESVVKEVEDGANTVATRPKRARAGIKMSKLVQKERDSDESADEESDVEEGSQDEKVFPHQCTKCSKRFKLLSNLKNHNKEHIQHKYNQRKYMCGICNARFHTHYDLKRHLTTHKTPAKPLNCEDCDKEYKDEQSLNNHKKIHTADHLYACNICFKTFTRRHDLKRHQASVHEDYHYTCGICGLAYKSQKTLTNHEIIHMQPDNSHVEDISIVDESEETDSPVADNTLVATSEEDVVKLIDSPLKGKRQQRRSYAQRGDRIFECVLCVKSYTTKDQLRQHILAHAGKYQHVCDFCGQGFFVPKHLKEHIFNAHGDTDGKEFSCTECCCCFRTEEELLKHGEWHGEKDDRVIISNKKLVQLIQKLDSSSAEDFMTNRSFWTDVNVIEENVLPERDTSMRDEDGQNKELEESSNQTLKDEADATSVEGEVKIQIQLDTSHEDLNDEEANKLLFGGIKDEKVAKPFTCKICLKTFCEKMYCRCHVLAHIGVYRHQCKSCGLGFLKNSDLKRHGIRCKKKTKKHKVVTMQCNDCQLLFDNEIEYMQHRQEVCTKPETESGEEENANEEKIATIENLKEEIQKNPEKFIITHEGMTNSGKPIRTCHVEGCRLQFANRPQLKQHLKQAHGIILGAVPRKGEKKVFEPRQSKEGLLCTVCEKTFESSVQLADHKATMHGEKGYSCSICGKAFGRKYDCQRHEENVHYAANSKSCDICGKVCKDKYTVQIHKKVVHEQIKEHVCPQCGHKFSQRSNLNNHMRTHTHEKPYQCSECLKWFSTKQYRDMHMRIHSGERPHKCTYCSRTFSHPASLKYHVRTHEDDRPYSCLTCPRKFRDPSKRSKHVKTCLGEQQSMIIARSSEGQTMITNEETGQVTLQLEQSVIDNLLLEPETTQIQIEHDDTIEEEHVQQIEQLIQDNQIHLEEEGTQVLVLDQGNCGDGDTVYLLVPSDSVSME